MKERLRKLRESRHLSRQAFGEMIGVSGDVINNLERGRVEFKEPMIKLIATTFSVSEDWLRNGGPDEKMDLVVSDPIEELRERHGLNGFQTALIQAIASMEPSQADALQKTLAKYLGPYIGQQHHAISSRADLHDELDRQLEEEKGEEDESSASSGRKFA